MKRKIFHFHNGNGGGVLSVISNLLKFSNDASIENHVIYTINKEQIKQFILPGLTGAAKEYLFEYSPKWNFYHTCKRLANLIPDDNAIIVAHDWLELGMVSNLGLPNPVIYILHGDFDYYYNLATKHSSSIDKFITVSDVIAKRLIGFNKIPSEDIAYLKFPVPDVATGLLNFDTITCAYIVKDLTDERKQFKLLPLIEKELANKKVYINWNIAGGSMKESEVKEKWGNQYSSRVQFFGELNRNGVNDLLLKSNLIILPSLSEGFPVGIVEAMKVGIVPLVTNWEGATDELIIDKETGFLFERGDIDGYVQTIIDLDRNKTLLKAMSEKAIILARRLFDPYKNTVAYENVFTTALPNKNKIAFKAYGSRLDARWLPNFITNFLRTLH